MILGGGWFRQFPAMAMAMERDGEDEEERKMGVSMIGNGVVKVIEVGGGYGGR